MQASDIAFAAANWTKTGWTIAGTYGGVAAIECDGYLAIVMVGAVQLPVIGIVSVSDYARQRVIQSALLSFVSRVRARVTQQRTFRALVLTLHRCSGALKELALRRMQQPVNCSLPINTYIRAQHRTHVSCSLIGRHYDADTFPARSPLFPISDKTRKVVGVDSPLSHDVTQRSTHRNSSLVAFTTFEMISAIIYYPAAAAWRS